MLALRGRLLKGVPLPHARPSESSHAEEKGAVLRRTADGKGDAVLATRSFASGDTVLVAFLSRSLPGTAPPPPRVGPASWARHGGLGPMVNPSCDPNCGVRLNDEQALEFIDRRSIAPGQELTLY